MRGNQFPPFHPRAGTEQPRNRSFALRVSSRDRVRRGSGRPARRRAQAWVGRASAPRKRHPGSACGPSPRAGARACSLGARRGEARLGSDREAERTARATMLLLPSAADGQRTAITRALTSGRCPPGPGSPGPGRAASVWVRPSPAACSGTCPGRVGPRRAPVSML